MTTSQDRQSHEFFCKLKKAQVTNQETQDIKHLQKCSFVKIKTRQAIWL